MIPITQSGCDTFTRTFYLAFVAWREARSAKLPDQARLGVMFVIRDRALHAGWWGKTEDEVATKRLQFSSLTDPNDKQLTTWPLSSDPSWFNCVRLACAVMADAVDNPVSGADSYYDESIPAPAWAKPERFVKQIGTLKFYDTDGDHEADAIVASGAASSKFETELLAFLSAPPTHGDETRP